MADPALLAVDGGNSKIEVALVAGDGTVLGAARAGAAPFTPDAQDRSVASLAQAIDAACRDAGLAGDGPLADLGVYCLAGADLPLDDARLDAALAPQGWTRRRVIRNDTFAVLRAGTSRPWGIGVVCGAGINCSGIGPDGQEVRFPALGDISGDLGGGGWLGVRAVGAAMRAWDGRGPRTELERTVPAYFGVDSAPAVIEAMHTGRLPEWRTVELPPIVFATAAAGDAVARRLADELADEVAVMATTAIRRLGIESRDVDVALGGGVFRTDDEAFHRRIADGIHAVAPSARLHRLDGPPVVGAALLGLDRLGARDGAEERVRAGLTAARLLGTLRQGNEKGEPGGEDRP